MDHGLSGFFLECLKHCSIYKVQPVFLTVTADQGYSLWGIKMPSLSRPHNDKTSFTVATYSHIDDSSYMVLASPPESTWGSLSWTLQHVDQGEDLTAKFRVATIRTNQIDVVAMLTD